jgi:hypothetical protein
MRYFASIIVALTFTTVHAFCGNRPLTTVYVKASVEGNDSGLGGATPWACGNGYGTVVCNPGQKATSNTRRGPYDTGKAYVCSTTVSSS